MLTIQWSHIRKFTVFFLSASLTHATTYQTLCYILILAKTCFEWAERALSLSHRLKYLRASNERKYTPRETVRDERRRRVRRAKAGRSEISTKPTVSCQKI